jgi:hypothetical protein
MKKNKHNLIIRIINILLIIKKKILYYFIYFYFIFYLKINFFLFRITELFIF